MFLFKLAAANKQRGNSVSIPYYFPRFEHADNVIWCLKLLIIFFIKLMRGEYFMGKLLAVGTELKNTFPLETNFRTTELNLQHEIQYGVRPCRF